MDIKPIETTYKGYRFRSRLEARWAVFFDACGLEWQYEPDGYDLGGEWYLPDFYLPLFKLYVEIKPFNREIVKHIGDGNEWEKKCKKFRDATGKPILLCYSDPAEQLYKRLFAWELVGNRPLALCFDCMFYSESSIRHDVVLITDELLGEVAITPNGETHDKIKHFSVGEWRYAMHDEDSWLWDAKLKARQARFEHGEQG